MSQITGAMRAAGLRFKENFLSAQSILNNGFSPVGGVTTIPGGGISLDGLTQYLKHNGDWGIVESQGLEIDGFTMVLEFAAGFDLEDGIVRRIIATDLSGVTNISFYKSSNDNWYLVLGGTAIGTIITANWAANWNAAAKNTIVISCKSGANFLYMNGSLVTNNLASTIAWQGQTVNEMVIGARFDTYADITPMDVYRLEFYRGACSAEDAVVLNDRSLLEDLKPENSLITLPLEYDYNNGSADQVTPALGTSTVSEVLLGTGSSNFPVRVAHRRKGYTFSTNSTYFDAGDSDQFSMIDGSGDLPFTLAVIMEDGVGGTVSTRGIASKGSSTSAGEFQLYQSNGRPLFMQTDNNDGSNIYKLVPALQGGKVHTVICTSDGTGQAGMKIYVDGLRGSETPGSSGAYTQMRNTAEPLLFGNAVGNKMDGIGYEFRIYKGVALSPMQVSALSRQMLNEAAQ